MLGQLYDDLLASSGLRATQHTLLHTIKVMKGPMVRELANEMIMAPSALGRALRPLERRGLVAMDIHPHDGRAKRVTLTEAGDEILDRTLELWRRAQDRFEEAVGRRRAEELRLALDSLSSEEFRKAFADGSGGRSRQ
jgi:DNA-binding MarR family transcriptional regulator